MNTSAATEFEAERARLLSEIDARLLADALSCAAGGQVRGGIRRDWRKYVDRLAALYRSDQRARPKFDR